MLGLIPIKIIDNLNSGEDDPNTAVKEVEDKKKEKLTIANVSDEKLINIIGQLMSTYKKYVEGQIENEPLEHSVIEEELNKPEYGKNTFFHMKVQKHVEHAFIFYLSLNCAFTLWGGSLGHLGGEAKFINKESAIRYYSGAFFWSTL